MHRIFSGIACVLRCIVCNWPRLKRRIRHRSSTPPSTDFKHFRTQRRMQSSVRIPPFTHTCHLKFACVSTHQTIWRCAHTLCVYFMYSLELHSLYMPLFAKTTTEYTWGKNDCIHPSSHRHALHMHEHTHNLCMHEIQTSSRKILRICEEPFPAYIIIFGFGYSGHRVRK